MEHSPWDTGEGQGPMADYTAASEASLRLLGAIQMQNITLLHMLWAGAMRGEAAGHI